MNIDNALKHNALAKVALVGGPDVDARIDLMRKLEQDFEMFAVGSEPMLRERFLRAGFRYRTYPLPRPLNLVAEILAPIGLFRLFLHERPNIVHAFDTKPCVYARLAARLAGVPIVVGTVCGLGSLYVEHGFVTRVIRFVYERLQALSSHLSDLTIFQNPDDSRHFVSKGIVPESRAAHVLGSGVCTDLFDPTRVSQAEGERLRQELDIPLDATLVTMVSRLIRAKGVLEFGAAAQAVRQRCPKTVFLLVGPEDKQSRDRISPAELSDLGRCVRWVGRREDIPIILATSDVFVLPTFNREGVPRALLEAASMGLPIITTASPGCREVVEHAVNGLWVPPRDPSALAQAILTLVQEPDLRRQYGQVSRQRVIQRFSLAKVAEQTRSIYHDLLSQKGLLPRGLE